MQRGVHPDVVEFAPGGASYRVKEDVRDTILPEAARAPIEAERRVLILFEAERLRGNQNESANAMLKTIEEPPPRTIVLLVTAVADDLLPTIRSRCQRIDFDPVGDDALHAALEREGIPPDIAASAAALAGGQLARARALAGSLAPLRAAFAGAPTRVDGTGATAFAPGGGARRRGRPGRGRGNRSSRRRAAGVRRRARTPRLCRPRRANARAAGSRSVIKREVRRTRIDLLLEGVTALETVYRDALADRAPPLNRDRPRVVLAPRAAAAALDTCREAREAILINEKGLVRLTHLLLSLPSARPA